MSWTASGLSTVSLATEASADPSLAQISLDRLLVPNARLVGIVAGVAKGPTLMEQIPALVESDLEQLQSFTLRLGQLAAGTPLP